MSIWTFVLNLSDMNIHTTIKKNYIKIMPSSTPHQNYLFYHLPTRGRAEIKLGNAWYVSNVSIIFDCSMLYYILFWMFNGLYYTLLYYCWDQPTNPRPSPELLFFCLFQSFAEKEYQTKSKRNETFGNVIFGTNKIQETWTLRQETKEEATR